MAGAVDPTYPLYPIASILATVMLLLIFLTAFIRKSWNLGVASLCFWLFLENLTSGINAILWADNADVELIVYCDIVTHLQMIVYVAKPMATLIITRRLYLIAIQQPIGLCNDTTERRETIIEWTLGLAVPIMVAGPIYYVVQAYRFLVTEGFGCMNSSDGSILGFLLIWSWSVVPPLVSALVYYPRVARLFYHNRQHFDRTLQNNKSLSRMDYLRILAFASLEILITLPIGVSSVILAAIASSSNDGPWIFYSGWTYVHSGWAPKSVTQEFIGSFDLAKTYYTQWTSPVLAFALFGLFGVTREARATYRQTIYAVGSRFGWKETSRTPEIRSTTSDSIGSGARLDTVLDLELKSRSSHVGAHTRVAQQSAGEGDGKIWESPLRVDATREADQNSVRVAASVLV